MIKKFNAYLIAEADAIKEIPECLQIENIVNEIVNSKGKLYLTGIGKAGYIARKGASIFSTTGTPASFIHPGDAPHGDIGVIREGDILIAISNSGHTREVFETIQHAKILGAKTIIAITSDLTSPIVDESDFVIHLGENKEICPLGLTPSASVAKMSAVCDALAFLIMEERGFTKQDFSLRHHGGYLGVKVRRDLDMT